MSKKIGILTSTQSFSDNYGAVLQAYALTHTLKEKGFEPYIIRYKVDGEYVNHSAPITERLKTTIFNKEMPFAAKKTLVINKVTGKSVAGVFGKFTEEYLDFYNEEYVTFNQLKESPPDFYAFITGSDQVWNPIIHGNKNDPGYFLKFVPEGIKRIAYAPSMGVSNIPEECEKTLGNSLEGFTALSVREKSGADIIKKCCKKEVPVVLDPTMLLNKEQWSEISRKPQNLPEKYIFCYKFGNSKKMDDVIRYISEKYNMPVVTAPAFAGCPFKADYTIGPAEFLSAIENASVVCTDSFHATAISIIFNSPFLTFSRHEKSSSVSMNSRMENLLDEMSLSERYIDEQEKVNYESLFSVDFRNASDHIEELRKFANSFINNALK